MGSSVTFLVDDDMDLRFTLASITPQTAVVDFKLLAEGVDYLKDMGVSQNRPTELVLHADPDAAVPGTGERKDRSPVEKIVHPSKTPEPAPRTVAEGKEIVDAAGEVFVCRWVERNGSCNGYEYTVKTWYSERVPGGVVRMVEKFQGPYGAHTTEWLLKSFERK